jgi:hypothetical protein
MKIRGDLAFKYKTANDAEVVFDSLEVDNENYLKSKLNNDTIEYEVESEKLGTFLATVDDLIASEIVVEEILKKTKQ